MPDKLMFIGLFAFGTDAWHASLLFMNYASTDKAMPCLYKIARLGSGIKIITLFKLKTNRPINNSYRAVNVVIKLRI